MARARTGQLIWRKSGWYARVTVTIDGERVRVVKPLGTTNRAVAKRKLERLLAADNAAAIEDVARPETFAEAAERVYEARIAEAGDNPRGARHEIASLREYACPTLGPLAVTAVKPAEINAVLDGAKAHGLSRQSVQHVRQRISNVFAQLRREGARADNPADGAEMPKFAKTIVKERAVLTDAELAVYLAYAPDDGRTQSGTLQRQVMTCVSRMFGGLRTGDLHALRWEAFDTEGGAFTWGYAPRAKTKRPQLLEVPEMLRPFVRDWWERAGRPTEGLVFPVRRGGRTGEQRRNVSHAQGMRRDLEAAFTLAAKRDVEAPRKGSQRWRELFDETEFTLPVDFHSWRRAFAQALADADVNAQQAQALTGHSSLAAHARYLRNAGKMRSLPSAALPAITISSHWARTKGRSVPAGNIGSHHASIMDGESPRLLVGAGAGDGLEGCCSIQLSYGHVSDSGNLADATSTQKARALPNRSHAPYEPPREVSSAPIIPDQWLDALRELVVAAP